MDQKMGQSLVEAMRELNEMQVLDIAAELVIQDIPSVEIFDKLLEGVKEVDRLYASGKYFIADLIMAGHIMDSVMRKLLLKPSGEKFGPFGSVVIATVKGDIHELGKNVVTDVLRQNGFEVLDLGVNVAPERIAEAVKERNPDILILSGMLKGSPKYMEETIRAVERAGLRDRLHIVVGGACVTPELTEQMGADAFSADVYGCLKICHDYMADTVGGG
jgi:methylmalonyl-CoA mutase cobalamin-binding domain/chain